MRARIAAPGAAGLRKNRPLARFEPRFAAPCAAAADSGRKFKSCRFDKQEKSTQRVLFTVYKNEIISVISIPDGRPHLLSLSMNSMKTTVMKVNTAVKVRRWIQQNSRFSGVET